MKSHNQDRVVAAPLEYEAPRIEVVLTDETLKREVQYAGLSEVVAEP